MARSRKRTDKLETEIDPADPRLPCHRPFKKLHPFDRAVIWLVCTMKDTWVRFDKDTPYTLKRAVLRLLQTGLVEGRVVSALTMDGFPHRVEVLGSVYGPFEAALKHEMLEKVPLWRDTNGTTKARADFEYEITDVRITDEGQAAREHWFNNNEVPFLLTFVRGDGPTTGAGARIKPRVVIEECDVVDKANSAIEVKLRQSNAPKTKGMSWQEAREKALAFLKKRSGGAMISRNALAEMLDCSRGTLSKAIKRTPFLAARFAERKAQAKASGSVRACSLGKDQLEQVPAKSREEALKDLTEEQQRDVDQSERQYLAASRRPRR